MRGSTGTSMGSAPHHSRKHEHHEKERKENTYRLQRHAEGVTRDRRAQPRQRHESTQNHPAEHSFSNLISGYGRARGVPTRSRAVSTRFGFFGKPLRQIAASNVQKLHGSSE